MSKLAVRGRGRSLGQWQALFAEQADSGLSQQAFCESRGLSTSAFYQAKSRMKSNGALPVGAGVSEFIAVSFDSAPPSESTPVWDVELTLGAGVVLRLRRAAVGGA